MPYVDGFIVAVPKKNLAAYAQLSKKAGKIWREHGALEYRECVVEDVNVKYGVPFTRAVKMKPGDTVVFAWIVFKSRSHRDRVNALVMNDPRLSMDDAADMPVDIKRMVYGGFNVLVDV